MKQVVIFSAPSGSGKTTIVRDMLSRFKTLQFSISATSRAPRGSEVDGVDYYFLTHEQFEDAARADKFIEWQEVYAGTCYGTLRSEVEKIWSEDKVVIFDVDVVGGLNLKRIFGDSALSIFIMPPSIDVLRERLLGRGTDSEAAVERRIAKAQSEIEFAPKFDKIVINDNLEDALKQTSALLTDFLSFR